MNKPATIFAVAITITLLGILVIQLHETRRTARDAMAIVQQHERTLIEISAELHAASSYQQAIGDLQTASALCRQRTESLRGVLEIMIPSGVWPDHVRLPDPPPGWTRWPNGNKYGLLPGE